MENKEFDIEEINSVYVEPIEDPNGILLEQSVIYLEDNIKDKMTAEEITGVFEKMCEITIEDDSVLFETGTFSFTGRPMFYFSLVRQIPNCWEEYYQLHLDIMFNPDDINAGFSGTVWSNEIDEDIFRYIKKSPDFEYLKNSKYSKIDIYVDQT